MHIDRLERYWLIAVFSVMGVFIAALLASVFIFGVRLPSTNEKIDPRSLAPKEIVNTEFAEPGLRHMGDNAYTAHFLAQTWFFKPDEICVPVGADVSFAVTSKDVVHGFIIEGHNVNMMLVPGEISRTRASFNRVGTFRIICHEYCGSGHHTMIAKIIVAQNAQECAQYQ
jgi:cytochrome c oxidase subunit 2